MAILSNVLNLLFILFFGTIFNSPLWIATQLFYLFGGSPSQIPF